MNARRSRHQARRQPAMHRAAPLLTRSVAALILVAFVGGSLAGYFHQAVERHARCPEHGEAIHVTAEPAATAQIAAAAGASWQRPGTEPGTHEHEHCYLCPSSRERSGSAAVQAWSPVALLSFPSRVEVAHSEAIFSEIYVLAPKTSPPV